MGASLACRLAESLGRARGLRVGLVEGRAPPTLYQLQQQEETGGGTGGVPDPRVYALAPASVAFLESVGAWPRVAGRRQDFRCMQVWEAGASGSIRFDASALRGGGGAQQGDAEGTALGTMAENSTVQSALFDRLGELAKEGHMDLAVPAQVAGIAFDDDGNGGGGSGPARVTLVGGDGGKKREVTARLLVGADGAASRVKKARGLPSWGWDYGQRALVATVAVDVPPPVMAPAASGEGSSTPPPPPPPNKKPVTAWQVFLPEGPLALLPLWGQYHSIVWSTTPAEADRLRRLPPDAFLAELNARLQTPVGLLDGPELPGFAKPLERALGGVHHLFESVVVSAALNQGACVRLRAWPGLMDGWVDGWMFTTPVDSPQPHTHPIPTQSPKQTGFHLPPMVTGLLTPRLGFDLRAEHATRYAAPRAVLVGDAAHTIHPMAGQGLNLGIADAVALAEVLEAGVVEGADLGGLRLLRRYEQARQPANLAMLAGLTALHKLYGTEVGPVRWLRNVGLGALNGLGPVKAKMAAMAMGLELRGGVGGGGAGMAAAAAAAAGGCSKAAAAATAAGRA